jgi:hypothetical protein
MFNNIVSSFKIPAGKFNKQRPVGCGCMALAVLAKCHLSVPTKEVLLLEIQRPPDLNKKKSCYFFHWMIFIFKNQVVPVLFL